MRSANMLTVTQEKQSGDSVTIRLQILRLSFPIAVTLLAQNVYHLIDSFFLARLGEEALSALALATIPQTIFNTLFVGIATGMNVQIAKAMGMQSLPSARKNVTNGLLLQLALAALIAVCGTLFVRWYFSGSSNDPAVITLGTSYLSPLLTLCVLTALQITIERVLQAVQLPKLSMISQITGFCVNLVLDPLLIFGAGRFSGFGMRGAAFATLAGQLVAATVAFLFLLLFKSEMIRNLLKTALPDWKTIREIVSIGIPVSAVSILTALGNYCINRLLISYQSTSNAVFGVYNRIETFLMLPRQALSIGTMTLFSFYSGKKKGSKIRSIFFQAELISAVWSLFCMLICMLFSGGLMQFFRLSGETFRMGIACFSIISSTYLLSGVVSIMNSFCQSTGKSGYALVFILIRQLVRIPTAILMFQTGVIDHIWWSWPVSEVISDLMMVLLFIRHFRRVEQAMQN